jgi:hypothetical protein
MLLNTEAFICNAGDSLAACDPCNIICSYTVFCTDVGVLTRHANEACAHAPIWHGWHPCAPRGSCHQAPACLGSRFLPTTSSSVLPKKGGPRGLKCNKQQTENTWSPVLLPALISARIKSPVAMWAAPNCLAIREAYVPTRSTESIRTSKVYVPFRYIYHSGLMYLCLHRVAQGTPIEWGRCL